MKKVVLHIEGMKCEKCQKKLEKHLISKQKIINAIADFKTESLTIRFQDDLNIEEIEKYIEEIGYKSKGIDMLPNTSKISKGLLIAFGVITIVVIYTLFANYFNLPIFSIFSMKKPVKYCISFLLITILYLFYFQDVLEDGLKRLLTGNYNLNTLNSISIIVAFLYSLYATMKIIIGTKSFINNTYFEIIIIMIYITKIAIYIDGREKKEIDREIKTYTRTSLQKVNLKKDNSYEEIPLEKVKENDLLVCLPGEKVLIDGIIVEGTSYFDEAAVTGESSLQEKQINSRVIAGSINCDKRIVYKVNQEEKDMKQLNKLVLDSKNKEKKYEKVIHKVGFISIPIILIILIIFFFINLSISNNLQESISKIIKILLITNPSVLLLGSTIGARKILKTSSKKGIIIKKSETLEKVKTINTIIFDKTGTLTNGYLCISRINNHSNLDDKELLNLLGSIEKNSYNPIGRGITKYLKHERINTTHDFLIEDLNEFGLKACDDKDIYYVSNNNLLNKLDIKNPYLEEERKMKIEGNSVIYLVKNNKIIALFGLRDIIKKETNKVLNILKEKKLNIKMLTGDNNIVSTRIAKELELNDFLSDLTIFNKKEIVEKMILDGKKVMYIGEGVNDSPALASSTIGITYKNSPDISKTAADIIFTNGNLLKIIDLYSLNKMIEKNNKQNIILYLVFLIILLLGIFLLDNIPFTLIIISILVINIVITIINTYMINK